MSAQCSHCGAQAPSGAKICFMCGGQVVEGAGVMPPTQPAGPAPGMVQAAPVMHPPPGMPGGVPVAPGPHGAPGYGPPVMASAPAGYAPPAGGGSDSTFKIGCGIAGCVGVLLVLVLVGGGLYFMMSASSGSTASGPSSGPNTAPNSGSLRSIVKSQVGDYRLTSTSQNVADGPFQDGAVDSLGMSYKSSSGVEVKHFLIAYSSKSKAQGKPKAMIELIKSEVPAGQTFTVSSQPYRNREGEVLGKVYHVETTPEVVMWTNGKLFAVVKAPASHAVKFFKAVPY